MSQGITFSGLGSGLDTDSIIQQLVAIERRPIELIQRRQVRLEQQKEIIQSIDSSLLSLKDSVEKLETDDLFSIVKARSEEAERVSVTATNEAAAGTFSVEVLALAQVRSLSSRSFGSLSDALDLSGEFVINGKGIEIAAEDSLLDIRDAINAADAGVSAQILTVATSDNRLILTADEVGEEGFDIKDASSTNVLQTLGFIASDTLVKNSFANGARSAQFLDDATAIGTLLGLGSPPSGTVTVGDQQIAVDLASDSLNDVRDKIQAAAPTGVTAAVVSADVGDLAALLRRDQSRDSSASRRSRADSLLGIGQLPPASGSCWIGGRRIGRPTHEGQPSSQSHSRTSSRQPRRTSSILW